MCAPDPNAGRREAARQENKKRILKYYSDGIKQWNKEVDFKDNINNILGLGQSRSQSDFTAFALSEQGKGCLLYTSPSPRDIRRSRMPSSA